MTEEDAFTFDDWVDAEEMPLRSEPYSEAALALVGSMLDVLAFPAPKKLLKPSTIVRRHKALGAMLADLLKLEARGLVGSHGMHGRDFSLPVHGFAFGVFRDVALAMKGAGLLFVGKGKPRWQTALGFDGAERTYNLGGWVPRFRLTPAALGHLEAAGIALDAWTAHWRRGTPLKPDLIPAVPMVALIGLRTSKAWAGGREKRGDDLPFDMDEPGVREMADDLEAHNSFMRRLQVDGIDFLGLRRSFNEGEVPARRWRSGGRFYSICLGGVGTRYENMSGEERRQDIRIAGKPVGEVDMSASQLRLLYAVQDVEMPSGLVDAPYSLPGRSEEERDAVKLVVAQALGKGKGRSKAWGRKAVAAYRKRTGGRSLEEDFSFATYQEAALAAHPILETLGNPGVPAALELQYVESEVVRRAMADLRSREIGSLPVHDSLIVAVEHLGAAQAALQDAFRLQVGIAVGYSSKHHARVTLKGA